MLVVGVAACSGLMMVASHGSEIGQQIKLLATYMRSNLPRKGMASFLEMMGFCCATLPELWHILCKLPTWK